MWKKRECFFYILLFQFSSSKSFVHALLLFHYIRFTLRFLFSYGNKKKLKITLKLYIYIYIYIYGAIQKFIYRSLDFDETNFCEKYNDKTLKLRFWSGRQITLAGEYEVAGTPALYERDRDREKIRIPGPIKEDIAVYVSIF